MMRLNQQIMLRHVLTVQKGCTYCEMHFEAASHDFAVNRKPNLRRSIPLCNVGINTINNKITYCFVVA